jgi:hypothetical protein
MYLMWENPKHQHPSSREIPTSNNQTARRVAFGVDVWSFSGCWSLVLGPSFCGIPCAARSFARRFCNRFRRQITKCEQNVFRFVFFTAV